MYEQKVFLRRNEKMLAGKGGLVSLLGTNNAMEVEKRIEQGDTYAKLVYEAMAYKRCKNNWRDGYGSKGAT